jgi:sigma-B regulation protein RsbQ
MIGLLAAVRRPELFRSLTLVGASPRYLEDEGYHGGLTRADVDELLTAMEENYVGWSRATAPVVMANPDRPELAEELAASFVRTAHDTALGFARAIFESDHRSELGRVRTPTLVVQASDDPMVPAEVAEHLHRNIPGSRLALLAATGHFPHVSGPAEIVRVVRAFLGDLDRGVPAA